MYSIVFFVAIFFSLYFLLRSGRYQILIIFLLPIFESNFLGSITYQQSQIYSKSGITLYPADLVYLFMLFVVVYNWKAISKLNYVKIIFLILVIFFVSFIFRSVTLSGEVIFQDIKNFWRQILKLFTPLYIYYVYNHQRDYPKIINGFKIISVLVISIFTLEYLGLYVKESPVGAQYFDFTVIIPETGAQLKRIEVISSFFSFCAPLILFNDYFKGNNRSSLLLGIAVLLVFFLSTYRTSFLVVFLTVAFLILYIINYETYHKKKIIKTIVYAGIIIALINAFNIIDLNSYLFRTKTTYSDLSYEEGTFLARTMKTNILLEKVLDNSTVMFFGSAFTGTGRDIIDLISLDLGIISTISLYGLIFTIYLMVVLYYFFFSNRFFNNRKFFVPLLRIYLLSFLPAFVFNYDPFIYFLNHINFLIGFALADQKNNIPASVNTTNLN